MFTKGRLVGKNKLKNQDHLFDTSSDESSNECKHIEEVSKKNNTDKSKFSNERELIKDDSERTTHGTSKSNISPISESASDITISEGESDSFEGKMNKQENFRGQNEDAKKPKKRIKRCQTSILNPRTEYEIQIPILSNGFQNKVGKPITITINTCTFDSVFTIYAACYVDVPEFELDVDSAMNMRW